MAALKGDEATIAVATRGRRRWPLVLAWLMGVGAGAITAEAVRRVFGKKEQLPPPTPLGSRPTGMSGAPTPAAGGPGPATSTLGTVAPPPADQPVSGPDQPVHPEPDTVEGAATV